MNDMVKQPAHYTEGRKYEPRKVIRDWKLSWELGNAVKYIARAGRKWNTIEDLEKAKQYIDFEIEALREEELAKAVGFFSEYEAEMKAE